LARGERDWLAVRRKIAFIHQFPPEWPGRVGINLKYIAAVYGTFGLENSALVEWYIERFGLARHLDYSFKELSGGYRMRYELVKALISNPGILVLDEPLAALDIDARQKFLHGLRAIADSVSDSIPVVISSQHIYEIEAIADNLLVLDNGAILYSGPVQAVGSQLEYLYFELTTPLPFDEVNGRITEHDLTIIERCFDGYVIQAPRLQGDKITFDLLYQLFSDHLIGIRNVTNSARRLLTSRSPDQ
jgi:ABC-type multidrug transport system ATPase subunit